MKRYKDNRIKLDKITAAQKALTSKFVKVGFIEGDEHPATDGNSIGVAQLAAIHEFGATIQHPGGTPYIMRNGKAVFVSKGTPGAVGITKPHLIRIPERSFLRAWANGHIKQTNLVMKQLVEYVTDGTMDATTALNQLGAYGQAGVKQQILALQSPPLSPATIAKKGSSKPLIDTGSMLGSVRFKVEAWAGGGSNK